MQSQNAELKIKKEVVDAKARELFEADVAAMRLHRHPDAPRLVWEAVDECIRCAYREAAESDLRSAEWEAA